MSEVVKKLVEEEGREARNIVMWNVPIDEKNTNEVISAKKPPTSPRPQSASPKPPMPGTILDSEKMDNHHVSKKCALYAGFKSRVRSSSAGRSPQNDLRARYWAFLFENLHRAVDEIYQTCETDESVVECKEAIMMLENYSKEFRSLIQWLNLNKDFESTPPPNRPVSLAWEIRKSSPGKSMLRNIFLDKFSSVSSPNCHKSAPCLVSTSVQTDSVYQLPNSKDTIEIDSENVSLDFGLGEKLFLDGTDMTYIEQNIDNKEMNIRQNTLFQTDLGKRTSDPANAEKISCVSNKVENPTSVPSSTEKMTSTSMNFDISKIGESDLTKADNEKSSPVEMNKSSIHIEQNTVVTDGEKNSSSSTSNNKLDLSTEINCLSAENKIPSLLQERESKENIIQTDTEHKLTPVSVLPEKNTNKQYNNEFDKTKQVTNKTNTTEQKHISSEKVPVSTIKDNSDKTSNRLSGINRLIPPSNNSTQSGQKALISPASNQKFLRNTSGNYTDNRKQSDGTSVTTFRKYCGGRGYDSSHLSKVNTNNYNSKCKTGSITLSTQPTSQNNTKTSSLSSTCTNKLLNNNNKFLAKNQKLHGSSSSLSSTSSGKSWADKVKGSLQELNVPLTKCTEEKNSKEEDDSEGWEMVRGRNRSRNSPAKKLGTRLQAKSYPDIPAKQSAEQFGSTASLQLSLKKTNSQNSNVKATSAYSQKISNDFGRKYVSNKDIKQSQQYGKELRNKKGKESTVFNLRKTDIQKKEESKRISSLKTDISVKRQPKLTRSQTDIKENCRNKERINASSKIQTFIRSADKTSKNQVSENFPPNIHKLNSSVENNKNVLKSNMSNKSDFVVNLNIKNAKNLANKPKIENEIIKENVEFNSPNIEEDKNINRPEKNEICEKYNNLDLEALSDLSDTDTISNNSCDSTDANNSDSEYQNTSHDINHNNDADSDGELQTGSDEQEMQMQDGMSGSESVEWDEAAAREEAQERISKLGLSWGDQMDHLDMELRPPGRALQMHEKLSSPYRKRSLSETIRRHEEKQLKAQEKREKLLEEKTQRFKDIAKKVEEMRAWKEEQQQQKRLIMEKKLRRAEEKRRMQLQRIVRKAHDEEEKVNEIAFINTLEAQNKRHDILSKKKDHEARLQDIQEERQRKLEEKAAKEAAAEERRKALEAERQTRLLEMQEKRKLRDLKIEQQLQEKEKERQELANQKARDRELRLSALNAAQQATLEELQKKIQQKQEESARRHEENMELIRQKAFELSVRRYSSNNDDTPQLVPYEIKKMCTLCNVLIVSEVYLLSHLRGKKHQETINAQHQGKDPSTEELESYNLKHIVDAPADKLDPNIALDKERQKALKKRCKKLRQRMTNKGLEYETSSTNKTTVVESVHKQKMQKIIKDINKLISNQGKGPWDTNLISGLERSLGEQERLFGKCTTDDKIVFQSLGGITTLMKLLSVISNTTATKRAVIPNKSIIRTATVYGYCCLECPENCLNVLYSNKIGVLLDYLVHCLNILIPDNYTQLLSNGPNSVNISLPTDMVAGSLMQLLAIIFTWLPCKQSGFTGVQNFCNDQCKKVSQNEEFQQRVHDVISYTVSIGIVDKLAQYFNNVRGPIDSDPVVADFLLQCMTFLSALAKIFTNRYDNVFEAKKVEDTTQLDATFRITEVVGTVSLLYGMLLHTSVPSRDDDTCPPELPLHTVNVTVAALCMLNHLAVMDLQMVQCVLGTEGLSLQLRHIASYLLWYCSHWTTQELLHEVILLVGYFTVLNSDNQTVIQSGQRPTVLQQLCSLPFQYFSDSQLTDILFPSLIACCNNNPHNKTILEQEMSPELLANYIEASLLDIHQSTLLPLSKKVSKEKEQKPRWLLSSRFPKSYWTSAKQFFSSL